jgi:hypothetical protein
LPSYPPIPWFALPGSGIKASLVLNTGTVTAAYQHYPYFPPATWATWTRDAVNSFNDAAYFSGIYGESVTVLKAGLYMAVLCANVEVSNEYTPYTDNIVQLSLAVGNLAGFGQGISLYQPLIGTGRHLPATPWVGPLTAYLQVNDTIENLVQTYPGNGGDITGIDAKYSGSATWQILAL